MDSPSPSADHDRDRVTGGRRRWVWGILLLLLAIAAVMRWGSALLIANDPLPPRVDAAIVLQGSIAGELARIRGAIDLLKQGHAERLVLSVPRESYWGEAVAPSARHYLEKNYGADLAGRVDFCETGSGVNSTEQEAAALAPCIQGHGWKAVAIVTSNYHSRRAGIIWRKTIRKQDPSLRLWIEGVPDPEFRANGWWRERLSAKTWYLESTKLAWTCLFG
jgi:uncharacterized SAM-binding protein YcdF (DUF218 family)